MLIRLSLFVYFTFNFLTLTFADEREDFINLFSKKSNGIYMKYMYQVPRDTLYIKDSKDYYPFDEEVDIIEKSSNEFAEIIKTNTNIVEIGPGAVHAVESKVLRFINSLNKPLSYTAIDIELKYAIDAPKIVKEKFPHLVVSGIATDITDNEGIKYTSILKNLKNKTIICFGSLFGNFDEVYREGFIKNISNLMNHDDLFIIDIDTNQDAEAIYQAYSNKDNDDILLNVMRYFKSKFKAENFDPEAFKIERKWEVDKISGIGYLKAYAVAMRDQDFLWEGETYKINKDDRYYLTFSAKFSKKYIEKIALKNKLQIKKIFKNDNNRINIFILTKV